jgi:hypothetical protein
MSKLLEAGRLKHAAEAAIEAWAGREGALASELRSTPIISESFLKRWMGIWMLARSNPVCLRPALASFLTVHARPLIVKAKDDELPLLVTSLAAEIEASGAARTRQTSLVSKFAFSLRPESVAPYDRRARIGLGKRYKKRINDHDFVEYYNCFKRFLHEAGKSLDETGLTRDLRIEWELHMSEKLFKMRTTDKYLMLEGGFRKDRM